MRGILQEGCKHPEHHSDIYVPKGGDDEAVFLAAITSLIE